MEGTSRSIKQQMGNDVYWKEFGSLTFLSLLPSDFQEQLALPKVLYKKLKLPDMVPLKCPGGKIWNVAVTTIDDTYYFFEDGWQRFVNGHTLKVNTFLTFEYSIERSCFKVAMFDHSTSCPKPISTFQAMKNIPLPIPSTEQEIIFHAEQSGGREKSKASNRYLDPQVRFPPQIYASRSGKPLSLLGTGIADIGIRSRDIGVPDVRPEICRFADYGVYMDPNVLSSLRPQWCVQLVKDLAENGDFFEPVISAPVEKYIRIVVFKSVKGIDYATQLRSAVLGGLIAAAAAADGKRYREEQLETLQTLTCFFDFKFLIRNSIITYYFPPYPSNFEVVFSYKGKDEKIKVKNGSVVAEKILRWYLGGTRGVSPKIIVTMANTLSAELSR